MERKKRELIRFAYIKTEKIEPPEHPQRHLFDEEKLAALVTSIKYYGVIEPLTVMKERGSYTVLSGERRLLAARRLGLEKLPCRIVKAAAWENAILALVANLHREPLTCFELAESLYYTLGLRIGDADDFCRATGLTQAEIERKLEILCLDERERIICEAAGVSEKRARFILTMPREERKAIFADLLSDELCLGAKAKLLCERLKLDSGDIQKRTVAIKDVRIFFNTIEKALEVMRQAGVRAKTERREGEEYVEYLIKIPSNNVLTGVLK